jgi:hypothetical protein
MATLRACPWVSGRTVLAACTPVVLLLSGCAASGTPGYDGLFGDAARALQAQQILDPESARRHAGLMRGTDGRTMREAMDRQVGSFKEPPATNVISIGVGAGGNGR